MHAGSRRARSGFGRTSPITLAVTNHVLRSAQNDCNASTPELAGFSASAARRGDATVLLLVWSCSVLLGFPHGLLFVAGLVVAIPLGPVAIARLAPRVTARQLRLSVSTLHRNAASRLASLVAAYASEHLCSHVP
jgi:hypothetical protein